jgi:hypothetical protein
MSHQYLHPNTFLYLKPSPSQMMKMNQGREAAAKYALNLEVIIPDGPDKVYILRKLRSLAMWVNVAITRNPDGSPRGE